MEKFAFRKAMLITLIVAATLYFTALTHIENFAVKYESIASVLKQSMSDSLYILIGAIIAILIVNFYYEEKSKNKPEQN
jgi:hypothetical protein